MVGTTCVSDFGFFRFGSMCIYMRYFRKKNLNLRVKFTDVSHTPYTLRLKEIAYNIFNIPAL